MKQFKGINGAIIKDLDTKQGIVTGYYSVFGNIDSDGDMIMPGAFLKTISENGPEGKHWSQ
jgi:phage head maturation protease